MSEPRTPRVFHEGSEEPFEDGLKLRDRDGDIWVQLEPMSWSCNGDDAHAVDWDSALSSAPLTEVLPEPAEAPISEPERLVAASLPENPWRPDETDNYLGGPAQCTVTRGISYRCELGVGHDGDHRRYIGPREWEFWTDEQADAPAPAVSPNAPEPEEAKSARGHRNGCQGCDHEEGSYPLCWSREQVDEHQRTLNAYSYTGPRLTARTEAATPAAPVVSSAPISTSAGKDTGEGGEDVSEALGEYVRSDLADILDAALERNAANRDAIQAWDYDTDLLPLVDAIIASGWRHGWRS